MRTRLRRTPRCGDGQHEERGPDPTPSRHVDPYTDASPHGPANRRTRRRPPTGAGRFIGHFPRWPPPGVEPHGDLVPPPPPPPLPGRALSGLAVALLPAATLTLLASTPAGA